MSFVSITQRTGRRWCSHNLHRHKNKQNVLRQETQGWWTTWDLVYSVKKGGVGHAEISAQRDTSTVRATVEVFPWLEKLPSGIVRRLDLAMQHLLPKGYQHGSVHKNYFRYVAWYTLAATAGSMVMVFSSQSMLYGAGLGAGAIPVAAALSWVLKDGIGQVGGVLFASLVNKNFDADPKRWRLVAGILLDASSFLEGLIPFFPALFLPLAAVANTGKNISFLAASATRASIHMAFANHGNLADITAKAGSQTTVASSTGCAVGAFVSAFLGSSSELLLVALTMCAAVHLMSLAMAIKWVPLQTLNLQRFEMLAKEYLTSGKMLDPVQVAQREVFVGPAGSHVINGYQPITNMGPTIEEFLRTTKEDVDNVIHELRTAHFCARGTFLLLSKKAASADVLRGLYTTVASQVTSVDNSSSFEEFHTLLEKEWEVQHIFVERLAARVALH
eukprot:TRINITY_DN22888_c0_g1_i1.p1 TRINITY_DN22888_c0_g1~~TRINITY_DN22888_c0_g1_i1.p1  ORF type:complete len:446 (+),score=65.35 TRINITY_DN22888_c0_g1_i1:69-1406(+)